MQARRLPALRGGQWIIDGFRLYRRNPPLLTLLALNYWLSILLIFVFSSAFLSLFPAPVYRLLGPFPAVILVQGLLVSVMNGCAAIEAGRKLGIDMLWSGFARNRSALLRLGLLYLVGERIAALILFLLHGDVPVVQFGAAEGESAQMTIDREQLLLTVLTWLGLSLPLTLAFWFAPMLAAWHDLPARKALFFSVVAMLRNWRAFVAYGAGALLLTVVLPALAQLLFAFSDALLTLASAAITIAMVLVAMPTLFASIYASYRDVIGEDVQAEAGD